MVGNDLLNAVDILGLKQHQERERFDTGSFGKSVTLNYDVKKVVRDKYVWTQLSDYWIYKIITDAKSNVSILVDLDGQADPKVNLDVTVEDLKGVDGSVDTDFLKFTWSQKAIDRHAGAMVVNADWSET